MAFLDFFINAGLIAAQELPKRLQKPIFAAATLPVWSYTIRIRVYGDPSANTQDLYNLMLRVANARVAGITNQLVAGFSYHMSHDTMGTYVEGEFSIQLGTFSFLATQAIGGFFDKPFNPVIDLFAPAGGPFSRVLDDEIVDAQGFITQGFANQPSPQLPPSERFPIPAPLDIMTSALAGDCQIPVPAADDLAQDLDPNFNLPVV
jgi:hypothetical protein